MLRGPRRLYDSFGHRCICNVGIFQKLVAGVVGCSPVQMFRILLRTALCDVAVMCYPFQSVMHGCVV